MYIQVTVTERNSVQRLFQKREGNEAFKTDKTVKMKWAFLGFLMYDWELKRIYPILNTVLFSVRKGLVLK